MQAYDAQKAAQIWQRVRGSGAEMQTSPLHGLNALLAQAAAEADTYQKLSLRFTGNNRTIMQKLAREAAAHTACLKGICSLVRGAPPAVQIPPSTPESPEITLRKYYRIALQSLGEYEARSTDIEYGQVFSQLAAVKRVHCMRLLELLGRSIT